MVGSPKSEAVAAERRGREEGRGRGCWRPSRTCSVRARGSAPDEGRRTTSEATDPSLWIAYSALPLSRVGRRRHFPAPPALSPSASSASKELMPLVLLLLAILRRLLPDLPACARLRLRTVTVDAARVAL